jgi:hypothetical protein
MLVGMVTSPLVRGKEARVTVSKRSTYFFAMPSWLDGPARLFDFWGGGDRYNWGSSPQEADAYALAMDWRAVGDDIATAINQFASERRA